MPSILVELGFISTPEEERFLNTEEGTHRMARGIFNAFITYKREQEIRLTGKSRTALPSEINVIESQSAAPEFELDDTLDNSQSQDSTPKEALENQPKSTKKSFIESKKNEETTFTIQILTSSRKLAKNDKRFKGLKDVDFYLENGLYKYTYSTSTDYNTTLRSKRKISTLFKDAFIIAFQNKKKININDAIRAFKNNNRN